MGATPVITAAQSGNGIVVNLTNAASASSAAMSIEIWRSTEETFWHGPMSESELGFSRVYSGGVGYTSWLDNSAESGTAYTYFLRVEELLTFSDSTPVTVSGFVLDPGCYIGPAADAVAANDETGCLKFRFRQEGGFDVTSDATSLYFSGRTYPVVEFSIHDMTAIPVAVDCPYGEATAGFGDEIDLLTWERDRTVVCYRDGRGTKVYGLIRDLGFTEWKGGRVAQFTVQPVDFDATVAST
jgi:hypothetical protein